jgi:hypothetical protein
MGLQIELAQDGRNWGQVGLVASGQEACDAVLSGMVSGTPLTGSPIKREHVRDALVGPAGLEPATSWFVNVVPETPPAMDDDEDPTTE